MPSEPTEPGAKPRRPAAFSLAGLLLVTAGAGMGLGALVLEPSQETLAGLTGVGLTGVLILFALEPTRPTARARAGWHLVGSTLALLGLVELAGLAAMASVGSEAAWWFAPAAIYAVVSLWIARRFSPGDGVLAAALAFHVLDLIPLFAAGLPALVFRTAGGAVGAEAEARGLEAFFDMPAQICGQVGVPMVVTLALAVVPWEVHRTDIGRTLVWPAILVGQAAAFILLGRWGTAGF